MDAWQTIQARKAKAQYLAKKQEFGIPVATCAADASGNIIQAPFKSKEEEALQKKGQNLCCDCSGNFRT